MKTLFEGASCTGQRWVSKTEPELGLGTLVEINKKTITLKFDASACTRQYAIAGAPLKRVIFKPGDEITLKDNTTLTVETVTESNGLFIYSDGQSRACETDLNDTINFSMPENRLYAGITDSNKLFDLRYQLLAARSCYDRSDAKGFLGGRVELIPHQFFIADTVTSRYIPRVLLSDETGLGKTIEACLILHKLLVTHRAQRILIIVPESLVHQWFIELYRKFNLSFMIFNPEYGHGDGIDPDENPFSGYQQGIISMDMLADPQKRRLIIKAGWDMVVIDEAHHITDNTERLEFARALSQTVSGMILLSATPEQMGVENHFLHLNLLDPDRYFDFDAYLSETNQYQSVIQTVIEKIKKKEPVTDFLDSYGPGRVIFRNKRHVVKGFPKRVTRFAPLAADTRQVLRVNEEFLEKNKIRPDAFENDPRVLYLLKLIKSKEKILVICRSKEKAIAIENAVTSRISVNIVRFDETMSLLQRDRNAAWFAGETGAQVLICSEIGSEGRNFQFVHHLCLLDLPLNPELLEQRIGRIDRIGQKNRVQIHVPFIRGSVYEILARWFMEGLNLFNENRDGVHLVFKAFESQLADLLNKTRQDQAVDEPTLSHLIQKTRIFCKDIDRKITRNKNILLEMNSFKPDLARKIIHQISELEQNKDLENILIRVLDHYGFEADEIDRTILTLKADRPADETFSGFSSRSEAATFDRVTAVAREDVDFFSWDHPFVQRTFEHFLTSGTGSCTTAVFQQGHQGIWLETVFVPECVAPEGLDMERYLPPSPIRIVLDHEGNSITDTKKVANASGKLEQDHGAWFNDIEQVKDILLPSLLKKSHEIVKGISKPLIRDAREKINQIAGQEVTRLKQLQKINPDVKADEIFLAQQHLDSLLKYLSTARLRLDALRLIRLQ